MDNAKRYRTWTEPPTGGVALVPLRLEPRKRSLSVWREALLRREADRG